MVGAAGGFGGIGGGAAAGGAGGVGWGGGAAAGGGTCGGAAAGGGGGGTCGGAAAGGGGGTCGGAAAGGGTCGGAAAGGGGVGRGGGAAAGGGGGGAGRAGAAGGAAFGGCLGFPSGPTSSLACATTSGEVCACDGAAAICSAVRAVVASSRSRSFVMVVWVLGKFLAKRFGNKACQQTRAINEQALGRIVASFKRELAFISDIASSESAFVHCAFRRSFQIVVFAFFPCGYSRPPGPESDPDAAKSIFRVNIQVDISRVGRGGGCVRSLRSTHRQFIRCVAWQFLWLRRLTWVVHGRRHLRPRASRWAFLRWLRGLAGFDRRFLWRVDRHFALSGISIW